MLNGPLKFYGFETSSILYDQWFFKYIKRPDYHFQVSFRASPVYQSLLRHNFKVVEHRGEGLEVAWERIISQVNNDRPVFVMIGDSSLNKYKCMNLEQRAAYPSVISDHGDAAGAVRAMYSQPLKQYQDERDMSWTEFKEIWGKNNPTCCWWEVHCPEILSVRLEEVLWGVRKNIDHLCYEEPPCPEACVGIQGMRSLADDIIQWQELEMAQLLQRFEHLFKVFQGAILERTHHSKYLFNVAKKMNLPELNEISDQLLLISQKWSTLKSLCLNVKVKSRYGAVMKVHGCLKEIVFLEEKAVDRLEDILALNIGETEFEIYDEKPP